MYSNANMANTALAGAYLAEEDRKRREQEAAPRQDSLLDTVGKIALAAGATVGAVAAGRRLTGGQNTSATFDLSQLQPKNLRRAAARVVAPQETVAPSRPAPTTSMERQRQAEEFTRQARSERMPGIVTTNLPQASVVKDPWTGRETIIDPFGVGTVPPVRRAEVQAGGQALPVGPATQEELAVRQRLLEDPELLKLVEAEEMAAANVLPENRAEQSRQQAQVRRAQSQLAQEAIDEVRAEPKADFASQYLKEAGYQEADTLVDQQVGKALVNSDQAVNAVNSAEDQQTGRVKMAFQRNEDENLAAIEFAEDQVDAQLARMAQSAPETAGGIEVDAAINQVAAQRPDGMPLDQAEGIDLRTGERFALNPKRPYRGGLQPGMEVELQEAAGPSKAQGFVGRALQAEREKIASELSASEGTAIPSNVEKELAERFGRGSYEYGREYTKVKQAMEAGLEDPRYLEAPAASVLPKTRMVGGQEFEVGVRNIMEDEPELAFRKPFISKETAISSEQQFVDRQNEIKDWLGGIRVEVAPQINKLQEQQKLLGEQQNMLLYSLNRQPNAELGNQLRFVSKEMQNNEMQLNRLNNRLSGATSAAQEQLSELEKWTPSTLVDWSGEGTVVRPKRTAPDTMSFEAEGGELSNIERGSRMAQPGPEDLEIVPGGLLSGGRARVVSNIGQDIGFDPATGERSIVPLVDPDTGEEVIQKLAGKRMGETIGVRGRGGSAGLETMASQGIYGTQLSKYGTAAQTQSGAYTEGASQVPSLVSGEPIPRRSGGFFKYPQQREAKPEKYVQIPTQQSVEAFDVARTLRQLQQSGRPGEAQAFLDKMMKQRGASSAGGSFSPLR